MKKKPKAKKKKAVSLKSVKPKPKKVTKPRIEVDYRQIEELCKIQCTALEICAVLGVSHDTLLNRCKEHYGMTFEQVQERYHEFGKASLRRMQFALAAKHPAMAIWLGKQYLGQQENAGEFDNDDFAEEIELLTSAQEKKMKSRIGHFMDGGGIEN